MTYLPASLGSFLKEGFGEERKAVSSAVPHPSFRKDPVTEERGNKVVGPIGETFI